MKFLKKTLPHLNWITKAFLVLLILGMLVAGGISIRLAQGPLDLGFIKPKIESALSAQIDNYNVEIGKLALSWDSIKEPLLMDLHQVKILQENNIEQVNTVDKIAIGLSVKHLMVGRVLPSIIEIENPVFQLIEENGELHFFWQGIENKNSSRAEQDSNISEAQVRKDVKEFLSEIFSEDSAQANILSALKRLDLKQAVLKSIDMQAGEKAYLALVDLSLVKNKLGLNGDLNVSLPSGEGRDAYLRSGVVYRQDNKDITFTAKINDINPSYLTNFFPNVALLKGQNLFVDGEIQAAFDDELKLQQATLNLNVPEGRIVIPDLYDEGLALKDIVVKADLDREQKTLNISDLRANIGDILVSGNSIATLKEGIVSAPINLNFADFATNNLAKIFPKSDEQSSAEEWLTKRLSEGTIKDLTVSANFIMAPTQNVVKPDLVESPIDVQDQKENNAKETTVRYDAKLNDVKASFAAEGLSVKYVDTLMPVTNALASGVYEDDTLTIIGEKGSIGDIEGSNINLKMTNLSVEGGGMAYLTLNARGPFKTALKYATDEPIAMGDSLGFKINDVKGNVNFDLEMEFPTIKDLPKEQVIVKIDGTLTDLMIPNIVRGLPLTGGPYKLKFADGKISLAGKGQLAKRDIDVSWEEYISPEGQDYESQIKASIVADEGLRAAFNIGLEEYLSGSIPIDVIYTDRGVPATVDVKGKLKQARLSIEPFDYNKPAGVEGSLSLKAYMKNDDLQEVDKLHISTEGFSLKEGRLIFKKLKDGSDDISRGTIGQAVIGKTNLKVDFEITPQNILKVIAAGPVFDMAPFTKGGEAEKEGTDTQWNDPSKTNNNTQPMKISLQAQKILAEKGASLSKAKIYLETDKQGDIVRAEMDANVGQGAMYVRFKPDSGTGKRNFQLESSDAGAALRAFGLYDKINGGDLIIYGEPKGENAKGNLFGKAKIENFSVSKAPVLANLLSGMSLNGVQDILQDNGLAFSKLESDFEWQFREKGNLLVMKNGRTSGSALGLTFEGLYDQQASKVDISGTVIPLSGVNKAIGDIPLIGQILTGGKAFLAATYNISGPSSDPKVSINPLSVLAPGFIRNILFEESVESKVKKAQ